MQAYCDCIYLNESDATLPFKDKLYYGTLKRFLNSFYFSYRLHTRTHLLQKNNTVEMPHRDTKCQRDACTEEQKKAAG